MPNALMAAATSGPMLAPMTSSAPPTAAGGPAFERVLRGSLGPEGGAGAVPAAPAEQTPAATSVTAAHDVPGRPGFAASTLEPRLLALGEGQPCAVPGGGDLDATIALIERETASRTPPPAAPATGPAPTAPTSASAAPVSELGESDEPEEAGDPDELTAEQIAAAYAASAHQPPPVSSSAAPPAEGESGAVGMTTGHAQAAIDMVSLAMAGPTGLIAAATGKEAAAATGTGEDGAPATPPAADADETVAAPAVSDIAAVESGASAAAPPRPEEAAEEEREAAVAGAAAPSMSEAAAAAYQASAMSARSATNSGQPAAATPSHTQAPSSATPVAFAAPPTGAGSARAVDQVADGLAMEIQQGRTEATIALRPAALGEVKVRIIAGEDGLVIRISAERDAVGELLRSKLGELRQALAGHQLPVAELHVLHNQPQLPTNTTRDNAAWQERPWARRGQQDADPDGGAPQGDGQQPEEQ